MDSVSMTELLSADAEKLKKTLRAGAEVDGGADQCAETIRREWSDLLLRHNAACGGDELRQTAADGLTAVAGDMADLLTASKKEKNRQTGGIRPAGPCLLAGAAAAFAAAAFLLSSNTTAAVACLAGSVLLGFLAGRFWRGAVVVSTRETPDPEALWRVLQRAADTVDEKIDTVAEAAARLAPAAETKNAPLSQREAALAGDLLECLYARNGDLALLRIREVEAWLRERGIELVPLGEDNRDLFEILPTKNASATLRPALMYHDRLLLPGRAVERSE